jgi:hypothetical protein
VTSESDDAYEESSYMEDSSTSTSSRKTKRSPLHNFQKHFVTTIRKGLNIRWPEEMSEEMRLAKDMWEVFSRSRKTTKEYVALLVGQASQQPDLRLLKKYGLLECYNRGGY